MTVAVMEPAQPEILLVEDDSNDIAVALRAFRRHSLEDRVAVLRDGAELVDYMSEIDPNAAPPKLILLDLKMPRIDGRTALRELRASDTSRRIPIVIISSSRQRDDVRSCYELGANSFVVKQINPQAPGEYLVDVVRYWLDLNEASPA
jgi:two-component system response regulator